MSLIIGTIRVLDPGLYTLLVDYGRPGSRSLGVPASGAADRASLALGNALVGNAPDTPALEISLHGPTLAANCSIAAVVFGAPFELRSDRQPLLAGKTFTLQPGEQLTIGGTRERMRSYLCIHGGFAAPRVLGSRSALAPLRMHDELVCQPGVTSVHFVRQQWGWEQEPGCLRFLAGAQADWFDLDEFHAQEFTVTPASNRMGLRLEGRPLNLPARELVSEPVCPGTVQVTRDGRCIVLGVDGQTIGGYPKIAQIISADIDRLGQLRPGELVRFRRVELPEAERLYRLKANELREWIIRLRAAVQVQSEQLSEAPVPR